MLSLPLPPCSLQRLYHAVMLLGTQFMGWRGVVNPQVYIGELARLGNRVWRKADLAINAQATCTSWRVSTCSRLHNGVSSRARPLRTGQLEPFFASSTNLTKLSSTASLESSQASTSPSAPFSLPTTASPMRTLALLARPEPTPQPSTSSSLPTRFASCRADGRLMPQEPRYLPSRLERRFYLHLHRQSPHQHRTRHRLRRRVPRRYAAPLSDPPLPLADRFSSVSSLLPRWNVPPARRSCD